MTRALVTALALLSAALPLGCGPGDAADAAPHGEQPPAPVEVAPARAGQLVDEWVFVGEVRSLRSAALALGAGGEIVTLDVREGDRVEAGQLLVEIDKRQASAKLSAAVSTRRESERELRQARREAERAAALEEILPSEEIERDATRADTLEARKGRLAAEIRAAKAQLSDYVLAAPFAGVVAGRYADLGQWVNPGETVLELVATDEVEILVDVRPELAPHVRVGDEVELRASGGLVGVGRAEPTQVTAEVLGIVPSLDPRTRTLKVRLRPMQARTWLLPGAPVEVGFPIRYSAGQVQQFEGAAIAQAVIVPRDALVLGAIDTRVIVVVDGAAKPIVVEIHASAGDEALVSGAGLSPGAVVVTRGNERLRPGQPVRPVERKDGGATDEAAS